VTVTASLAFIALTLVSCEDDKMNKIAMAQKCLDGIDEAHHADATDCEAKIAGVSGNQADEIRCAIQFVAGGLTTSHIVKAAKRLHNETGADKTSQFIVLLTLSDLTYAQNAVNYCQSSGVEGLIYFANLALIGTTMASQLPGDFYGTISGDLDDDAALNGDLTDVQQACVANPHDCAGDGVTNAISTLADSYCVGDKAKSDVCVKILGAQDSGVTEDLICSLYGKTFSGGACI
jgi:hypothetical protein